MVYVQPEAAKLVIQIIVVRVQVWWRRNDQIDTLIAKRKVSHDGMRGYTCTLGSMSTEFRHSLNHIRSLRDERLESGSLRHDLVDGHPTRIALLIRHLHDYRR